MHSYFDRQCLFGSPLPFRLKVSLKMLYVYCITYMFPQSPTSFRNLLINK